MLDSYAEHDDIIIEGAIEADLSEGDWVILSIDGVRNSPSTKGTGDISIQT